MPTKPCNMAAIILAAGASTRFGSQKMAHRYKNKSLLEHSIDKIDTKVFQTLIVVTGANSENLLAQHKHLQHDCKFIENTQWKSGLSTSIAAGITALEQSQPKPDAALFLLGDQIAIAQSELNTMAALAAENPDTIVCARYNNKQAAPAIFPSRYFSILKRLRGDKGASSLLNNFENRVLPVDIASAANDIDRPEDLEKHK